MRVRGAALGLLALMVSPAFAGGRVLAPMDVVAIRILEAPEFSRSVRIAEDGTIAFPYLGRIRAAGHTEDEIAQTIGRRLVEQKILTGP